MANEKNLISLGDRTTSEQREIAQMGGIASGVARRERKRASEVAQAILNSVITLDDNTEATTLYAILKMQVKLALDGNTKAFEKVLRLAGEWVEDNDKDVTIVNNYYGLTVEAREALKHIDEL